MFSDPCLSFYPHTTLQKNQFVFLFSSHFGLGRSFVSTRSLHLLLTVDTNFLSFFFLAPRSFAERIYGLFGFTSVLSWSPFPNTLLPPSCRFSFNFFLSFLFSSFPRYFSLFFSTPFLCQLFFLFFFLLTSKFKLQTSSHTPPTITPTLKLYAFLFSSFFLFLALY